MADCNTTNYQFPMYADVHYASVGQGAYGDVQKVWTKDRSIISSLTPAGTALKEEMVPNVDLTLDALLLGRFKEDIRFKSNYSSSSLMNILITNIRDSNNLVIYKETSGPRTGQPTLFEVATHQPFTNPFGRIEYFTVVLRRSENQGITV